jgi:hypothetical protein
MMYGLYALYEDWMNARVKPVGKFEMGDIKVPIIEVFI